MQHDNQDPTSPCIGVCSIDMDSHLCAGCFRNQDEISSWLYYSASEKQDVLAKVTARIQKLFT